MQSRTNDRQCHCCGAASRPRRTGRVNTGRSHPATWSSRPNTPPPTNLGYYLFLALPSCGGPPIYGPDACRWYIEDYHLIQGADEERYNPAVRRHLKHSGIPVETSRGEWGRGHNEMNIRYAEAIDMADRHSIMKLAMKDIATTQDIGATFMAKPGAGEAGSKLPCPSQPLVG